MSSVRFIGLFWNPAMPGISFFGVEGATFQGLLGFVGNVSVVLWALVLVTAIGRFIGVSMYRRASNRRASIEGQAVELSALPVLEKLPALENSTVPVPVVSGETRQLVGAAAVVSPFVGASHAAPHVRYGAALPSARRQSRLVESGRL